MATEEHRSDTVESVRCAILTISDTRTPETDRSGAIIRERLASAGHRVVSYQILPDDVGRVKVRVQSLVDADDCEALILTGGTGVSPRDATYEATTSLFEKRLDGFGELFRMLSFDQVGAAAMLSRATAGIIGTTIVFLLPGSTRAVELALDRLIIPELGHIVGQLHR